jgi:hypothetical protein
MRFNPMDQELLVKKVALERLDIYYRREMDQRAIGNGVRFESMIAHESDRLILQLRAYVWAEAVQDETVTLKAKVSYPATWWQHFKQRWFAAWMLKRCPVAMTTVSKEESHRFKTLALLPGFRYEAPSGCSYAYVMRTTVGREY